MEDDEDYDQTFKCSQPWFSGTYPKKKKYVTPEMVGSFNKTAFPTILSKYALSNIYNFDEFGLFYLPQTTFHLGGVNAVGDKLPLFCHWEVS